MTRAVSPRTVTLGVIQTSYDTDLNANIEKTIGFIREAADRGGAGDPAVRAVPGSLFLRHPR